jgi:hypothetical protein
MQIVEYCGSILTSQFPIRVEQNFTLGRNQQQKMDQNVTTIGLSYLVWRLKRTNGPCSTIFLEDLSDRNMLEHFNSMTSPVINPNPLDWQSFLLVVMAMTWHWHWIQILLYIRVLEVAPHNTPKIKVVYISARKKKTKVRKDQSCIVLLLNTCILFDLHVHSLS